ncbi:MAG: 3-methyl-2-oxobutanoate hydroxymethyltransferase [Pseudomonadota bacterium]
MYAHLQNKARTTPPVSLTTLRNMKEKGEKIASLTAYDASFGILMDEAGVDVVLIGDSLGMVIQGRETTVPVTMDDILYHCKAVSRGLYRGLLMADMPFMSYTNKHQARDNAARLMQEGGAKMVKLEGGSRQMKIVDFLAHSDIPICAHIGLTPQSVHKIGGFRVQGRGSEAADRLINDAKSLEEAGADVILMECIPAELGAVITSEVSVPVIGIGAGPGTDGQILVLYDILDITTGRKPRFSHNFMQGQESITDALRAYVAAVKNGDYPAEQHCFV